MMLLNLRTYVSFLQGWGIVDTIPSHGNNGTLSLTAFNNDQLLLWRSSGKYNLCVVL